MSVLESIKSALNDAYVGEGDYPSTTETCGKIVFKGGEKPVQFLGGKQADVETFKVIIRGDSYRALEAKADSMKNKLLSAGFIQIGGYEDIVPKTGETFMQLAVSFKFIK